MSKTFVSVDDEVIGHFEMRQVFRDGVREAISVLKKKCRLSLISGDNAAEEPALRDLFGSDVPLHFQQSPHDKLDYIRSMQQAGGTVMMIGDGLNDAGALKQADVGIAVSDNVHSFSPACDGILSSQKLGQLPAFLTFARQSIWIVYLGFAISLGYNVIGLSFAVQAQLAPVVAAILMPVSSLTVVVSGVLLTNLAGARLVRSNGGAT